MYIYIYIYYIYILPFWLKRKRLATLRAIEPFATSPAATSAENLELLSESCCFPSARASLLSSIISGLWIPENIFIVYHICYHIMNDASERLRTDGEESVVEEDETNAVDMNELLFEFKNDISEQVKAFEINVIRTVSQLVRNCDIASNKRRVPIDIS